MSEAKRGDNRNAKSRTCARIPRVATRRLDPSDFRFIIAMKLLAEPNWLPWQTCSKASYFWQRSNLNSALTHLHSLCHLWAGNKSSQGKGFERSSAVARLLAKKPFELQRVLRNKRFCFIKPEDAVNASKGSRARGSNGAGETQRAFETPAFQKTGDKARCEGVSCSGAVNGIHGIGPHSNRLPSPPHQGPTRPLSHHHCAVGIKKS